MDVDHDSREDLFGDNDDSNEHRPPLNPKSLGFRHKRHRDAAKTYGDRQQTQWEQIEAAEDPNQPYHPWNSLEEYELVDWLATSKLSQAAIDKFLALTSVTVSSHPFKSEMYSAGS